MFDIHAHILPALDDGPETFEEALRLVAELAREGVVEIAATPRYGGRYARVTVEEVRERAAALERVALAAGFAVRLLAGHEIELDADAEDALASGVAATLNDGPYALISIPGAELPAALPDSIVRLRMAGIIPVLASVERHPAVQRDPDVLAPLVRRGALLQVTAASLAGAHGEVARQTLEVLLPRNLAHVLASGVRGGARAPHVITGLRRAEMLVGQRRLWELSVAVPRTILRGGLVETPPVLPRRPVAHASWPGDSEYERRSS